MYLARPRVLRPQEEDDLPQLGQDRLVRPAPGAFPSRLAVGANGEAVVAPCPVAHCPGQDRGIRRQIHQPEFLSERRQVRASVRPRSSHGLLSGAVRLVVVTRLSKSTHFDTF